MNQDILITASSPSLSPSPRADLQGTLGTCQYLLPDSVSSAVVAEIRTNSPREGLGGAWTSLRWGSMGEAAWELSGWRGTGR